MSKNSTEKKRRYFFLYFLDKKLTHKYENFLQKKEKNPLLCVVVEIHE